MKKLFLELKKNETLINHDKEIKLDLSTNLGSIDAFNKLDGEYYSEKLLNTKTYDIETKLLNKCANSFTYTDTVVAKQGDVIFRI